MIRAARLAAPLVVMMVVWRLSSIPAASDHTMAGVFVPKLFQKAMHVAVYATLCSAWLWVFDFGSSLMTNSWAIGLTTAYAAVDEVHQTFVPGRWGSPWDVALDACAAALAVGMIAALRKRTAETPSVIGSRS